MSWDHPSFLQAQTVTFTACRAYHGEDVVVEETTGTSPRELTGLTPGDAYRYSVTAVNAAGSSAEVFAGDDPAVFTPLQPAGVTVLSSGGGPRAEAIAVCQHLVPGFTQAARVVLARDDAFADALAGASLVGRDGCVLFTEGGPDAQLDPAVLAEIDRVLGDGGEVHVLGGVAADLGGVTDEPWRRATT